MGNIIEEDFREFIEALNKHNVEYILVGGFSVILYGYSRTTGDLDLWMNKSKENYERLFKAFNEFGMQIFDMTEENFLNHPVWDVFSFGRSPVAIDIMTAVKGLDFKDVHRKSKLF